MAELRLSAVSHRFTADTATLSDVSLVCPEGSLTCLLGPSGCGKTTLLRLIAGLEDVQQGEIQIGGRVVASDRARSVPVERRSVGLVFQDFALFPHLSVLDNVLFGLRRKDGKAVDRARGLLNAVGLNGMERANPNTLSGGQMQRVALARALAPEPEILLLDEPFSSLDPSLRDEVRATTRRVLKETGTTAVMVTHDAEEAMRMADRIAVLGPGGKLHQVASPAEMYEHPADPYVAGIFGPVNWIRGTVENGQVVTPLGRVPAAPGAGAPSHGLSSGAQVTVMIRPEYVRLCHRPCKDAPTPGTVLSTEPMGRMSHLHIQVPGQEGFLEVDQWGLTPLAQGQTVGIGLDPERIHVFPVLG